MKKVLAILALVVCVGGCAQLSKGICWVDTQIKGCPEETPAPAEDGK